MWRQNLAINPEHVPYARETAICVDLAYDAMEEDIRAELELASAESSKGLTRLLDKLLDRRKVLDQFTRLTVRAA